MWQWPAAMVRYSCAEQRSQVVVARRDRRELTSVRSGSGRKVVPTMPSICATGTGAATRMALREPSACSSQAPPPSSA